MPFPKADEKTRELFLRVLPEEPGVQVRPMFGQLAAFVNGNMFAGIFGSDIVVRLPDAERERLLKKEAACPFAPMGREMKEYVLMPRSWRQDEAKVRRVLRQSLEWAAGLPPKSAAPAKKTTGRSRAARN